MPYVDVNGVKVNFPFDLYPCQFDYMQKLITCLREGYNGILESPTGTGKTLCLLCASLAWLEDKKAQISSQRWKLEQAEPGTGALNQYKEELAQQLDVAAGNWSGEMAPPKIIYASRTHTQLTQVMQELKRTAYAHFKVCVLGSREQLCIHPQVMKEESNTAKVHLCRAKVTARSCHFYNSVDGVKNHFENQVLDIEDLVRLGEKNNCCPYYMARELRTEADVIFMPYNYLLDPKTRKAHGVELQGNIIIFDEAHNLERICEESASFDLKSADLAAAIREINDLSLKLQDTHNQEDVGFDLTSGDGPGLEFSLEDVLQIKAQILHLEEEIDSIPLPRPEEGVTKPGSFIFDLLTKVNLSFETKPKVVDMVDKIISYLTSETNSSIFNSKGAGLSKFADVIKIVFSRMPDERTNITSHQKAVSKDYKVHIQEESKNKYNKKSDGWGAASAAVSKKATRVLSYWCFSPGHAMEDLKARGVRSIILTSGTLSPMTSFIAEMGIEFPIQLENPHVIEKHQVWIGIVGQGPDGVTLSSAYNTRFREDYQSSLGNSIVNFARVVPHGLLVFFPSYPVMDKCLSFWQNGNIWNRIEQYKPIFVEPRTKAEFHTAMTNFYEKIEDPTANGALFAAVCRGKVSEGLDFSDINGRAVVITGLPFPPRMDPRVMLKMQFLDEARRQGGKGLTGQQWYRQQASRAVNQAIGRVIRHKQDYGAILLCDTRFSQAEAVSQLPSWIRPHSKTYKNFGVALKDMMIFYKTAQQTLPQPVLKSKRKAKLGALGCEGAFFQPTLSRNLPQNMGNVEKAGRVATHVPSLKTESESKGENMARLKVQYENTGPGPRTAAAPPPRSLLEALQCHEGKADDTGDYASQIPSYQVQLRQSQVSQAKQKKIVLKKADGASGEKGGDSLQSAQQYVAEVKKTLSVESYKFFSRTLENYKKSGDYNLMVSGLADIFTDNPQNHHLFRKFYRFVRHHHKQQFDKTCKELTGQGCGFKPEDAVQKKRNASNPGEGSMDKRRKTETETSQTKADFSTRNTKSTSKSNTAEVQPTSSVYLDASTNLNQGKLRSTDNSHDIHQTKKSAVQISGEMVLTISDIISQHTDAVREKDQNHSGMSELLSKVRAKSVPGTGSSRSRITAPHTVKESKRNAIQITKSESNSVTISPGNSIAADSTSQDTETTQLRGEEIPSSSNDPSNTCEQRHVSSSDCSSNDKENIAKETEESSADFSATSHPVNRPLSGYICCHCGKDAAVPLKAMCQHVCCMECWKTCIRELKKCPECGEKVKRKHLSRIFFPSGPDRPQ